METDISAEMAVAESSWGKSQEIPIDHLCYAGNESRVKKGCCV
jgi:hypothetical protein